MTFPISYNRLRNFLYLHNYIALNMPKLIKEFQYSSNSDYPIVNFFEERRIMLEKLTWPLALWTCFVD